MGWKRAVHALLFVGRRPNIGLVTALQRRGSRREG
jgi:hypothetical protein